MYLHPVFWPGWCLAPTAHASLSKSCQNFMSFPETAASCLPDSCHVFNCAPFGKRHFQHPPSQAHTPHSRIPSCLSFTSGHLPTAALLFSSSCACLVFWGVLADWFGSTRTGETSSFLHSISCKER